MKMRIVIAERSSIIYSHLHSTILKIFPAVDPEEMQYLLLRTTNEQELLSSLKQPIPDFLILSDEYPVHQCKTIQNAVKLGIKVCVFARRMCFYNCRITASFGARSYLTIETPLYELQAKLTDFFNGKIAIDDATRKRLGDHVLNERPDKELSDREWQVAQFLAEGYTCQKVADYLFLSEKTIQSHRANILKKLGLSNVTKLALYAVKSGMIENRIDTGKEIY